MKGHVVLQGKELAGKQLQIFQLGSMLQFTVILDGLSNAKRLMLAKF
jgi:hypothetical protein